MSYAGELGWEFHMPNAACLDVYTALWSAGEAHAIADYGSFAMNVMRMEKGFKGAGELTNEVPTFHGSAPIWKSNQTASQTAMAGKRSCSTGPS